MVFSRSMTGANTGQTPSHMELVLRTHGDDKTYPLRSFRSPVHPSTPHHHDDVGSPHNSDGVALRVGRYHDYVGLPPPRLTGAGACSRVCVRVCFGAVRASRWAGGGCVLAGVSSGCRSFVCPMRCDTRAVCACPRARVVLSGLPPLCRPPHPVVLSATSRVH